MISNYISYAISLIEILFIGGAVWGWGFMQYMFEKEYVFYDSQCLNACLDDCIDHPDNTSEYIFKASPRISKKSFVTRVATWTQN